MGEVVGDAVGAAEPGLIVRAVGAVAATRSGNVARYGISREPSAAILEVIARSFDHPGKRE